MILLCYMRFVALHFPLISGTFNYMVQETNATIPVFHLLIYVPCILKIYYRGFSYNL